MANIKSAKKRIKTIAKRTEINKANKSELKTAIKKVYAAEEKELATQELKAASKLANKNVSKGTIHKNKAARLVSKMAKAVNALEK